MSKQRNSGVVSSVLSIILLPVLMLISASALAETYYFHNDHLGTPQVVTDKTQTVVWKGEYDPFGQVTETVALVEQNLRFPGQYFDVETGLHYNYFRSYDPGIGRYIQSDPIGLTGGLNTYAYVGGNPLNYTDPYGLWANVAVGVGVRVVGGRAAGAAISRGLQNTVGRGAGRVLSCLLIGYCSEAADDAGEDTSEEGGQCPTDGNTNPYSGPVDSPIIVVDGNGNAIPVGEGESITSSPDGTWQQVRDPNGNPTGSRMDGGHNPNTHSDPRAQQPHVHVPGVTNSDGTPWLPR